jgi:hypothetical protein
MALMVALGKDDMYTEMADDVQRREILAAYRITFLKINKKAHDTDLFKIYSFLVHAILVAE